MSPCDGRPASATRRDLLVGRPIEIRSEPVQPHPRSAPERGDGRLGADESMPPQRGKLADRDSIPGHDERFAVVKLAHNVAAVIAQLPLGDLFGHTKSVARVLRNSIRGGAARATAGPASVGMTWAGTDATVVGSGSADMRDFYAAQRLSSRTTESIIVTLMMHTITQAQPSSSQPSMPKRPALVVIHSDVQQHGPQKPSSSPTTSPQTPSQVRVGVTLHVIALRAYVR